MTMTFGFGLQILQLAVGSFLIKNNTSVTHTHTLKHF